MEGSSIRGSAELARAKQLHNSRRRSWRQVGRSIVAFLAGSSEPTIHRFSDCDWRVFDPASGQLLNFSSEKEVRIWLDQRYSL